MIVSFGKGQTILTGPLIDGYVLRQSFVAKDSHLKSVRVLLSTYKRRNDGFITATIVDHRLWFRVPLMSFAFRPFTAVLGRLPRLTMLPTGTRGICL